MKTELIHFTMKNTNKIMYNSNQQNNSSNTESRSQMKKILSKAIFDELTDRQRTCVTDYYVGGKKVKEIANELGLNPSTVSRHISVARKKLRHIASYYK